MRSLALAAAVAAGLPGCSIFMHSIEKPTAEVRQVSVSGVTFSGATGVVALDVTNPNSFGVPLSGMDWQLSVGGARAFTGTVQLSQTIPAKAAVPVETTLSIGATDAITVSQMLARGVSSYRIDVTLHFSTKVGPVDVALHHDGELGSIVAMR